jgi:hypothetical protein
LSAKGLSAAMWIEPKRTCIPSYALSMSKAHKLLHGKLNLSAAVGRYIVSCFRSPRILQRF